MGVGCIGLGIRFCPQTVINFSALFVSLMALHLTHVDSHNL